MSGEKTTSPCNKFQANIFNKTKCQNCFMSRELHLLNDHDMEQAKPIYGGWLCLAPEGTDFDNPMQRSRKWQRRFFILYEDGSLSFALDELPSTLPQGTVNMNLCTEITDAEPRTGQKNALCIITPEQEIFIRGDNKEIINGWSDQLSVYLRINKQNPNKKRKVEPVATQEPSPAKMAATDPSFPSSESCALSSQWQEDQLSRRPDVTSVWTVTDPPGLEQTPAGKTSDYLCSVRRSKESLTSNSGTSFGSPVLDLLGDGNNHLAESNNKDTLANDKNQCRSTAEGILGLEAPRKEQDDKTAVSRKGRSEARTNKREKLQSCGDISQLSVPHPQRRAKSLDGRTSDNVMTPDLLNFKKGWMVKLHENDQWKKYWFVLSTNSLRFYKDSVAEEASDVEGEIDLTMCYNVSEYQVQRNYGFQIHTPKAVFTLSAMTAGIRRNWIQALMKNVHPANAPDVATLPGHHVPCSLPDTLPKPDVTQDSPSADVSTERNSHLKPRSVREKREGRYKTFDCAAFRPPKKLTLETDLQKTKPLCLLEMGDLERRKRREERRRRYESMLGFSLGWENIKEKTVGGSVRALSPTSQKKVEEDIEECWRQVEKTKLRLERSVPLYSEAKDTAEMEKLLESYKKWAEDLTTKLEESEHCRLELESVLRAAGNQQRKLDSSLIIKADWDSVEKSRNSHTLNLNDVCEETRQHLQQQNILQENIKGQLDFSMPLLASQTPSIWLHDTEGNFQELGDLLPDNVVAPLLSPHIDNQDLLFLGESQVSEPNLTVATNTHENQLIRADTETYLTSEALINTSEYSTCSLIPDKADDNSLNLCGEQHIPPDPAIVRRLSQEVELLTIQNQALNQHNQEMLNQLTEADCEIERLKSELSSRYADCAHHLPDVEQQGNRTVEHLERELGLRNQELIEAQMLITSLEESLREAESLLQTNIPAATEETGELKSVCASKAEEYLLKCFETTESKLTELERQLNQSELTCKKLQAQNIELKEVEKLHCQITGEVNADISMLSKRLEKETIIDRNKSVPGKERILKVIEAMVMRLEALSKLLEVINRLHFENESEHEDEPTVISQVKWEESFWTTLLSELQAGLAQSHEEKPTEMLLSKATEHVLLEKQVLLLGHDLLCGTDEGDVSEALKDLDNIWNNASFIATETKKTDKSGTFECTNQICDIKCLRAVAQGKISLLNQMSSCLGASSPEKLQVMADRLYNFHFSDHTWSGLIYSAATEALYCCRLSRLQSIYKREQEKNKNRLLSLSLNCSNCVKLMEEFRELEAKCQQASTCGNKTHTYCQTETDPQATNTERQIKEKNAANETQEENVRRTFERTEVSMEIPPSDVHDQLGIQEISDENTRKRRERETVPSEEMDQVSVLRRKVEELEELLSVITEEMKEDFDGQMSSVQMQHENEMEKLRSTCQRGFSSMQESHQKVVEELQCQHQQEVERLLVERDTLLEEESAATVTAIKAIKYYHLMELERELQRQQSEKSSGNILLEDIYRQHSEELASYQRELEVLSQQFSLKCLENRHLVQALDAERKALCQCQQENQDLRTRNQELSVHLAEEITRLCSLVKQDDLPLSQGLHVYEMEITLRVKESEVQCLKQMITSLKEELQSAQKDKRNATKKYKEMYTELSIVRAKAERDMNELRENLRLAHQALGQTSP